MEFSKHEMFYVRKGIAFCLLDNQKRLKRAANAKGIRKSGLVSGLCMEGGDLKQLWDKVKEEEA